MYQSLIFYIIVILIYSTHPDSPPEGMTTATSLLLTTGLFALFYVIVSYRCRMVYRKATDPDRRQLPALYDRLQLELQAGAVIVFSGMIYGTGLGSLIDSLPPAAASEGVNNLIGLSMFFLLQTIIWRESHRRFSQDIILLHPASAYIKARLRFALGLMVPWLTLLFAVDLLNFMIPQPLAEILQQPLGEVALFIAFLLLFTTVAPPLLVRFWGCSSLPDSDLRLKLAALCHSQKIGYRRILIWPAFEGRMATAAVVGAFACSRYLLLTPDLIHLLNDDEILAVTSHELGHVRYHHLLIFLFFFLSFFVCNFLYYDLMLAWALTTAPIVYLLENGLMAENTLLSCLEIFPLLIIYFLFFRYVFGFFLRNFERQADLASLDPPGFGYELVSAFNKLGLLLGAAGRKPNWHHFNIPQRITFLQTALTNQAVATRHHRFLKKCLLLYIAIFSLISLPGIYWQQNNMITKLHYRYLGIKIEHQLRKEPDRPELWFLLASLYIENNQEDKAIKALHQARQRNPEDPEVLNSLAWLLLTAKDLKLRDYGRALTLARKAADLKPEPYILDTLAEACWRHQEQKQAIAIEEDILKNLSDPDRREYYREQLEKFNQSPP